MTPSPSPQPSSSGLSLTHNLLSLRWGASHAGSGPDRPRRVQPGRVARRWPVVVPGGPAGGTTTGSQRAVRSHPGGMPDRGPEAWRRRVAALWHPAGVRRSATRLSGGRSPCWAPERPPATGCQPCRVGPGRRRPLETTPVIDDLRFTIDALSGLCTRQSSIVHRQSTKYGPLLPLDKNRPTPSHGARPAVNFAVLGPTVGPPGYSSAFAGPRPAGLSPQNNL